MFFKIVSPNVHPVGGDGGEEDSWEGSQSLHCVTGLRLPDKGRTLSGHDHHEWRRPQVTSHSEKHLRFQSTNMKRLIEKIARARSSSIYSYDAVVCEAYVVRQTEHFPISHFHISITIGGWAVNQKASMGERWYFPQWENIEKSLKCVKINPERWNLTLVSLQ